MGAKRNSLSRAPVVPANSMNPFIMGLFSEVESSAVAPHIVLKSFADFGLLPWNPERIRELVQTHCPPPSKLSSNRVLRKLERIMDEITAEQEIEQNRIISIGRCIMSGSSEMGEGYQLRERKSKKSQRKSDAPTKPSMTRMKAISTEIQSAMKRCRNLRTTSKPQ